MKESKKSVIPPANRYHGLKNQGATCYLNSVLQVLFMTKEFREAVKREQPETENIDLHLTNLFDNLTKCTAQTCQITRKLGISRVHEQRDAAEYFEKILSHTSPEASQIFQGQLTHKNICSKCHTETDTDGPFWSLPLALKDSYSENYRVVDGFKEFFKASDVSGDNQMYCDECDHKADATMKCVMKHHPEVLVLLLKRFEFDYRYMEYVKISRCVDVPCTLKIPENETYELYGFVDHFGNMRGGHYTATIKCQDDKSWYNFNDTMVTRLPDNQSFQMDNTMK
ncbi:ubiquitin carboxyl-terminal hydrolase 47-like [Thunnus maccoyii]|uniref:ubiquitin carboxyl-terminal hydrolase 47-like n=1 Tax=Thunnus maccoyii TaxID=8240 RepID=UPI001C4C4220|nr:ubiquitin carboxyl-terminal hydrolase 47-like [Thunnus maccoyii]